MVSFMGMLPLTMVKTMNQWQSYSIQQSARNIPDFNVTSSGLVISATWPWLATSPNAIAHDLKVEVKCHFMCQNQSLSLAVEKLPFLECCTDGFRLKQVIRVQKLVGLPPPALELLGVFLRFRKTFAEVITFSGASAHEF